MEMAFAKGKQAAKGTRSATNKHLQAEETLVPHLSSRTQSSSDLKIQGLLATKIGVARAFYVLEIPRWTAAKHSWLSFLIIMQPKLILKIFRYNTMANIISFDATIPVLPFRDLHGQWHLDGHGSFHPDCRISLEDSSPRILIWEVFEVSSTRRALQCTPCDRKLTQYTIVPPHPRHSRCNEPTGKGLAAGRQQHEH